MRTNRVPPQRSMELIEAAMAGSLHRVERALADGLAVDFEDPGGQSALFWAVIAGDLRVVEVLLSAGASVEKRNSGAQTPLMGAALRGHLDCISALLEAGAEINAADDAGLTAWAWAALESHAEACEFLGTKGADTMLHHANWVDRNPGLPTIELAQLAICDGLSPGNGVYLACLGLVFDVSAGINFYGPGAPYAALAGRDATLALASQDLNRIAAATTKDVFALPIEQRISVEGWCAKFKEKYPVVGRLFVTGPGTSRL